MQSHGILKSKTTVQLNYGYVHVNMRTHACICMFLSFIMWSIVGQTRVISGMKKREASMRNLHIVKNVNEGLNTSSFRSLRKFTDKLRFNTCLIFSAKNLGRKLKQPLEIICISRTVFIYRVLQSHVMFTLDLTAVHRGKELSYCK